MIDSKYVVFKRDEFIERHGTSKLVEALQDAVVIRTQDVFAAPALDAYANSIWVATHAVEQFITNNGMLRKQSNDLKEIGDYFHERAVEAWARPDKKLPD